MNTGQMAMVIGAFMLFGVVSNNFQRLVLDSTESLDSNTNMQSAITIARSMMDEITSKPFDVSFTAKKVGRLSDLGSCGRASGEYYPNINDCDDYHGLTFVSPPRGTTPSTTPRCLWGTEGDTIRCFVQYVSQTNPQQTVTGVSWAKRVTVTVTSRYSTYPLTMSHVVTY